MATEKEKQAVRDAAYEIEKSGVDAVEAILVPIFPHWKGHEDYKDPELAKAQQEGIKKAQNEW